MKITTLKTRVLIPLTIALGILLTTFVYYIYHSQRNEFSSDVGSHINRVQELFDKQLESETELLNTTLEFISIQKSLQQAWMAKDRNALFQASSPLLKKLGVNHRITHFYFHNPDRTNFLRVYDPERFGDTINRFTLKEAVKKGHNSAGIELGKLGTMTLRVVHPWVIDGQIVGYIEMGEEIDHIIEKLHNILDVNVYVSIYKEYLDRKRWEAGMQLLGRQDNWDFSPFAVIVSQTLKDVPAKLKDFLKKGEHDYLEMDTDLKLFLNERNYRVGVLPLFDAGGREIGDILILSDVTTQLSSFNKTVLLAVSICIAVGLALFIFFSALLGKLESKLSDYQNNLEFMVTKRTEELTKALDEIKTLQGIIPICANCKQIRDDEGIWNQLELYISEHSEADFSHGICPDCARELYPGIIDKDGKVKRSKS